MKKITPQFLPHVERAPQFVEAVRRARQRAADEGAREVAPVVERLDAFEDDPFLLYSCLWYAYSQGVPVVFTPAP